MVRYYPVPVAVPGTLKTLCVDSTVGYMLVHSGIPYVVLQYEGLAYMRDDILDGIQSCSGSDIS